LHAVEVLFNALVNVDEAVANLVAFLDDLAPESNQFDLLMDLEKAVVSEQVVQLRDRGTVAPCAFQVPFKLEELQFVIRASAVVVVHR